MSESVSWSDSGVSDKSRTKAFAVDDSSESSESESDRHSQNISIEPKNDLVK